MRLIDIILEYTEQEKRQMGIPDGAVSRRGGRWYASDQKDAEYLGRTIGGKFVAKGTKPQAPATASAPTTEPQDTGGRQTKSTGEKSETGSEVPIVSRPTKPNPSFEELSRAARRRPYTIMSSRPLESVHSVSQTGEAASIGKPDGFWFAAGSEWVDWTESEMPQWKGDNLYDVEVNEDECIVIEDEIDMREFHAKYRTRDGSEMIDWQKVSKDAKGVIFKRYFPEFRRRYKWYYTWDIASGCVWDASAIKQVEQIPIT